MADPTTANTSMSVPIRGSDVGTWDVPVNGNFNILDNMFGGVSAIALSSSNVTLASSQGQSSILRFTGTLVNSVSVTLPGIYKFWTIDNQIVNSPSSFAVTLVSTNGASVIGCPPGTQDVFYDGTTVNYRNLGRIGEYWDYAAATVPTWVTASTKPPYLNCAGATFSSATYPILANLLGTTTLPDARGSTRYALNQGTARLTSSNGGLDGNTIFSAKTTTTTLGTSNLPPYTPTGTIVSTAAPTAATQKNFSVSAGGTGIWAADPSSNNFGITVVSSFTGAAQGGVTNPVPVGPALVFGITMIRAA